MSKLINLVYATGTVVAALATGYVMQPSEYSNTPDARAAEIALADTSDSVVQRDVVPALFSASRPHAVATDRDAPGVAVLAPSLPETAAARVLAAATPHDEPMGNVDYAALAAPKPAVPGAHSQPQRGCSGQIDVTPSVAATVELSVRAPCNPNTRITIHHNGMMFSALTDDSGAYAVALPALAERAVFMVEFEGGGTLVANTEVTSMPFYDRAVVQWAGDTGLHVHAFEFGAEFGSDGHVHFLSGKTPTHAATGRGGYLVRLGDDSLPNPLIAEVYTFPSGMAERDGDIQLHVEAEVSVANCSRTVAAQSIQYSADRRLSVQDLSLEMPECDEYGGYLVLKNLLQDLTIARN